MINLPPVTNSEDWYEVFEAYDDDAGAPFDFTGWSLSLTLRRDEIGNRGASLITAADTTGQIAFPSGRASGQFTLTIPQASMSALCPGTYPVGVVMERDGEKFQLILGVLPVLEGVV